LNAAAAQLQQGTFVVPSKQTLNEYLEEWLPAVQHSLRSNTYAGYRHLSKLYVIPKLGHVRLAQLTPQRLNAFYGNLLQGGGRSGKPLSRKTVQSVHLLVNRALGDAAKWGMLARNPASLATPPKPDKREMRTWTPSEVQAFLEYVRGCGGVASLHYTAYMLAVSTGMRRGEILGLRWRDVDLEKASLSVQQVATAYGSKGSLRYTDPKTKSSRRRIALDSATVEALREWRKQWFPVSADLVFTDEVGSPLSPGNFSQRFVDVLRRAQRSVPGLPRIRFHDLRHTHATLALAAGVHPKVVQERLGHSDISVTLGVYSHVVEGMQEEAAALVGATLWAKDLKGGLVSELRS
jgi:integrase